VLRGSNSLEEAARSGAITQLTQLTQNN
jgi:hypothetical protein